MKRWTILAFGLVIAAGVAFILQSRDREERRPASSSPMSVSQLPPALGVEELMKNVDRYPGTVRVEGVVREVSAGQPELALIDIREFQECGISKCNELVLPVHWLGPMPSVEDVVRLEGEVRETSGKLAFVARNLEKAGPPSGGPG